MCLAKAYSCKGDETELILEDVSRMTIEGDNLQLRTLFGEQKEIRGLVKEVDFQNARIIIEQAS